MPARPRSSQLTFGKDRKLSDPGCFRQVRLEGTSYRGALLTLGLLQDRAEAHFRAGFVTSRRVGSAVIRNRVRRRLREIVRKHQHSIRPGIWLVVVARPAAARSSTGQLTEEWLRLANRASILAP